MSPYIPAIITSEVAMHRVTSYISVANAEANFRDLVTWVLVTRARLECADGVPRQASVRVEEAFGVSPCAAQLDEVNGVSVAFNDTFAVGSHGIKDER